MDRKVRGMSMLELLVVITIIAVLGSIALIEFRNFILDRRLKSDTERLISMLETAKRYSLSGRNGTVWGVNVLNDRIQLFQDNNGNCTVDQGEVVQEVRLESGVQVQNPGIVIFDKKGIPRNAICGLGPIGFNLAAPAINSQRIVCVSSVGRIRYVLPPGQCGGE
ncbi:prepilin-type N-terminal cleavage/methylation domain-containing protein [Thermocrinis minervae]|uniref:Type IV fimbrial biogenesis protein FimT n=1 Tax=Thermocrinis minervae TaxID=381751 RepID=A0A1M6Q0X6_9AQUI|nr:prepilin-type N-terminal cleavage/methylation domain-containing protein [Thermocrinis minervae]SHK13905.1 type IV fimbrial biogenesis protein FimT [Thermocrinis minervae]